MCQLSGAFGLGGPSQEAMERQTWSSAGPGSGHPWREGLEDVQAEGILQSMCKCPQRMWQVRRAGGKAKSGEGAPGHIPPCPLSPPQGSVTVMIEHASHITASGQHEGGKAREELDSAIKSFLDLAASEKTKSSFWYSRLKRASERTRPPLSTEQVTGDPRYQRPFVHKQLLRGEPDALAIVTFSRGQHAVHAVGGHRELREAWIPAFQDTGSVNIPARRKRESGLLRPCIFHLGQGARCPLWNRTGQEMKCLSE